MRSFIFTAVVTSCFLLTPAATLSAHEGHGSPVAHDGLLHYVVNPSHSIPFVIFGVSIAWFARKLLHNTLKRSHQTPHH